MLGQKEMHRWPLYRSASMYHVHFICIFILGVFSILSSCRAAIADTFMRDRSKYQLVRSWGHVHLLNSFLKRAEGGELLCIDIS